MTGFLKNFSCLVPFRLVVLSCLAGCLSLSAGCRSKFDNGFDRHRLECGSNYQTGMDYFFVLDEEGRVIPGADLQLRNLTGTTADILVTSGGCIRKTTDRLLIRHPASGRAIIAGQDAKAGHGLSLAGTGGSTPEIDCPAALLTRGDLPFSALFRGGIVFPVDPEIYDIRYRVADESGAVLQPWTRQQPEGIHAAFLPQPPPSFTRARWAVHLRVSNYLTGEENVSHTCAITVDRQPPHPLLSHDGREVATGGIPAFIDLTPEQSLRFGAEPGSGEDLAGVQYCLQPLGRSPGTDGTAACDMTGSGIRTAAPVEPIPMPGSGFFLLRYRGYDAAGNLSPWQPPRLVLTRDAQAIEQIRAYATPESITARFQQEGGRLELVQQALSSEAAWQGLATGYEQGLVLEERHSLAYHAMQAMELMRIDRTAFHQYPVIRLAFLDQHHLVSASVGGEIHLTDIRRRHHPVVLPTGLTRLVDMVTIPAKNLIVAAGVHGPLLAWRRTGPDSPPRDLLSGTDPGTITALAVAPDQNLLVIAASGELRAFDPDAEQWHGFRVTTGDDVRHLAFDPGGGLINAATAREVLTWRWPEGGALINRITLPRTAGGISSLLHGVGGVDNRLLIADESGNLHTADLPGEVIQDSLDTGGEVVDILADDEGGLILIRPDGIRRLVLAEGRITPPGPLVPATGGLNTAALSPSGSLLLTGAMDYGLSYRLATSPRWQESIRPAPGGDARLAVAADGRYAVTGSLTEEGGYPLIIRSAGPAAPAEHKILLPGKVMQMAFAADGDLWVSGLDLWDIRLNRIDRTTAAVTSSHELGDSRFALTERGIWAVGLTPASVPGPLQLFGFDSFTPLPWPADAVPGPDDVWGSDGGDRLAFGPRDGDGPITITGPRGPITSRFRQSGTGSLTFTGDGTGLISTDSNGHVHYWRTSDGERLLHLPIPERRNGAIAVLADGEAGRLITGQFDLRIHSLHTGRSLSRPLDFANGSRQRIRSLAFTPDRDRLLVAAGSRLWSLTLEPGELVQRLCRYLTNEMEREEELSSCQ